MLILGTRLFGKVDVVPGAFHVATRFFHLNFLPLWPASSWVVLPGGDRGVKLSALRWSSVLMAWARALLVLCALGLLLGAFVDGRAAVGRAALLLGLAAACGAALLASYRLGRASTEGLRALTADPAFPAELARAARAALGADRSTFSS
jgi:hypothetical protein